MPSYSSLIGAPILIVKDPMLLELLINEINLNLLKLEDKQMWKDK